MMDYLDDVAVKVVMTYEQHMHGIQLGVIHV